MQLERDDLSRDAVRELLVEHLADMHAESPPESVHALNLSGLRAPGVTFWSAWADGELLGCCALKELTPDQGELKSMRTPRRARRRGTGAFMLRYLIDEARARGYTALYLETGTQDFFAPARTLYAAHGFQPCGPFADYADDPYSAIFRLHL